MALQEKRLRSSLIASVGRIATAMPKLMISILLTIIACFYTSFDLDKIKNFFFSFIQKGRSKAILGRLSFALKAYAKAYLLLFVLTFFELLIGLLILRRPYAFILALIIAAIDILPVFGAGKMSAAVEIGLVHFQTHAGHHKNGKMADHEPKCPDPRAEDDHGQQNRRDICRDRQSREKKRKYRRYHHATHKNDVTEQRVLELWPFHSFLL
jgi:hypothetical protein